MHHAMDSDSEDDLPGGWEQKTTADGNVYFLNTFEKKTQWTHPRTGRKKVVPAEMPFGWRQDLDDSGRTVYVHKGDGRSSYVDPRLAFVRDEKTHVNDFRQRFDSSSTAYQVLTASDCLQFCKGVLHGVDLSGKCALITGCNAGIGYETAKSLARHGCKVLMANRNMAATKEAISRIAAETNADEANLVAMHLDLASLNGVKRFAMAVKPQFSDHLDMVILNAGIFGAPYAETEDGLESTLQVNHVAHAALALYLRPLLRRGARVLFVSSESHRFGSFKGGFSEASLSLAADSYSGMTAYNNSKLFNVLTAKILSEEWAADGICVNSLHPGNMVSTNLCNSWWLYKLAFALVRPFTKSLQQAAATSVYVATAPELEGVTGLYFNNCFYCQESALARDRDVARLVFSLTLALISRRLGADGLQAYLDKYPLET